MPGRQRQRDVRSEAPRFFDIADCALSAIGGICRQLEPSQRCFNIIQAVCRIRVPVTVIWFRLAVERYAVDVVRRNAQVCGVNSAVAISCVTNEGSVLERH